MNRPTSSRSPGFHLWHAALAWRAAVQEGLGDRLTATQFFVLGSLVFLSRSGAPTQAAVAKASGTDPMTTSQVVRALEARGLLRRRDDPSDSRSWLLEPTAEGRALLRDCAAAVREVDRRFFADVDDTTLSSLEALHDR